MAPTPPPRPGSGAAWSCRIRTGHGTPQAGGRESRASRPRPPLPAPVGAGRRWPWTRAGASVRAREPAGATRRAPDALRAPRSGRPARSRTVWCSSAEHPPVVDQLVSAAVSGERDDPFGTVRAARPAAGQGRDGGLDGERLEDVVLPDRPEDVEDLLDHEDDDFADHVVDREG